MWDPNRICLLLLGSCCILGIIGDRCWYRCSGFKAPMVVLVVVGKCSERLEGAVRLIRFKAEWFYSCRCFVAVTLQTPEKEAELVLELLKKDGLVLDTILGGVPNNVICL